MESESLLNFPLKPATIVSQMNPDNAKTFYRGADKSLARIDYSYVKIKRISCLLSL